MAGPSHFLVKTTLGPQAGSGVPHQTLSIRDYPVGKSSIGHPVPLTSVSFRPFDSLGKILSNYATLCSAVALASTPDVMTTLLLLYYGSPEINMPQSTRPGVLMQSRPWNYTEPP